MHILNKSKKIKGLTLVEVVVALSIFAIVFSGTATLIISVVNLAMISKERTEAISYAQKGLALRIKSLDYGCSVKDKGFVAPSFGTKYSLTTTYKGGNYVDDGTGAGVIFEQSAAANPDFIKVEATIHWNTKFGEETETVSQIIRSQK